MTRIAIVTTEDAIWSLSAWTRAIPVLLANGYDVAGLWTCDDRMGKNAGDEIYQSYISIFGYWNYFKLGLFGVVVRFLQLLLGKPLSIENLAKEHGLYFQHCASINDNNLIDWVQKNKVEVLLVTVSQIIKEPLLDAVKIINRHPGLLPDNKGVFPYFWACLNNSPQGISYHLVTDKIDEGAIIFQHTLEKAPSMLAFDVAVSTALGADVVKVLENSDNAKQQNGSGEYHTLPTHMDYLLFREKCNYITRLIDIFLAVKLVH